MIFSMAVLASSAPITSAIQIITAIHSVALISNQIPAEHVSKARTAWIFRLRSFAKAIHKPLKACLKAFIKRRLFWSKIVNSVGYCCYNLVNVLISEQNNNGAQTQKKPPFMPVTKHHDSCDNPWNIRWVAQPNKVEIKTNLKTIQRSGLQAKCHRYDENCNGCNKASQLLYRSTLPR